MAVAPIYPPTKIEGGEKRMKTRVAVPLSTQLFLELADFLRKSGDERDPTEVVEVAVEYWLENASWKPESEREDEARGYQWKTLFLPGGTDLRMRYKGAYVYAKVDGDRLVHEGEVTTPGALVNRVTGTSRNAWRDLWIKRPSDQEWHLAEDLRGDGRAGQPRG
jgi:hypothetical protein